MGTEEKPNDDGSHPFAEERPFWAGVAVVLTITIVGLVAVFFLLRVGLPYLLGSG